MSTFKTLICFFSLFCLIGTVNADSISMFPSHIDWYIDSEDIGNEIFFPTNFTFIFYNIDETDKCSVFIEGSEFDNIFFLETNESFDGTNLTVTATLFMNISYTEYVKDLFWGFNVVGKIDGGLLKYQMVSKINIYKDYPMQTSFLVVGAFSLCAFLGIMYIADRRKKDE